MTQFVAEKFFFFYFFENTNAQSIILLGPLCLNGNISFTLANYISKLLFNELINHHVLKINSKLLRPLNKSGRRCQR